MKKNIQKLAALLLLITLAGCKTNEPTNFTTWRCLENSPAGSRTYLIDMYRSIQDTTIYLISNFHKISAEGEYDVRVKRTNNTFKIEAQPIGDSQYTINSGSGIINNNSSEMQFNYIIFDRKNNSSTEILAVYNR